MTHNFYNFIAMMFWAIFSSIAYVNGEILLSLLLCLPFVVRLGILIHDARNDL